MIAALRRLVLPGSLLVLISWAALALVPAAARADPAAGPFATITGTDPGNALQTFGAASPLAAAHSNVIVRLAVSGTGAQVNLDEGLGGSPVLDGGEIVWGPGAASSYAAGDTPSIEVYTETPSPATFEYDLFDVPSAPTSFTGASYLDPTSLNPPADSTLDFTVPGDAPYVANVTIASGAVSVGSQTLSSSGQVSLGHLGAGPNSVSVDPVAGPLSDWTVAINPVPIVLSDVKFSAEYARSGASETLGYSLDGDATITATIANASGTIVRTLASAFAVPDGGSSTLPWDGRNSAGDPVPDGTYTATIGSTDAVGNVSKATATIEIDSTPPTVSLLAKTIKSNQAVVLKIRDALSGVATATATFDNGHTSSLRDGQEQLVYAPSGGWTPGAHKVVVVATDRAGNRIRRAFTFTVAGLTAEQVAVAADKVLATSPSTSQDRYRVVSCQAVGQITFRGHPASLWQCELKSPLSVGGTTVYAIVVGDTLYLDRSRP